MTPEEWQEMTRQSNEANAEAEWHDEGEKTCMVEGSGAANAANAERTDRFDELS